MGLVVFGTAVPAAMYCGLRVRAAAQRGGWNFGRAFLSFLVALVALTVGLLLLVAAVWAVIAGVRDHAPGWHALAPFLVFFAITLLHGVFDHASPIYPF